MYLAIVGLPGISFLVGAILGRRCGRKGISNISSICILLASILSIIGEVEVVLRESPVSIKIMRWVGLERMDVEWGLLFDGTSMTMAVVVLSISGLVHMYSNWYLEGDAHKIRYLSYISLFTWMMLIMVTADNYILMFVGWEGIGLSSYLLINYWYRRVEANKSSMKALLMNRVGDWGLTIGILYIYMVYENVDYSIISGMGGIITEGGLKVMTIYILIGAIAKSAQIGQKEEKAYILRNAGSFSKSLKSEGLISESFGLNPEKFSRQGNNQQKENKEFKDWLVGFTEGDGSFTTSSGKPVYSIHLNKVDEPLLYEIQAELGMGNIYIGKRSAILIVKAKNDIKKLIEMFNGEIYLNKVLKRFSDWVKVYSRKYKEGDIIIKGRGRKPIEREGWLSGFSDAEGSFIVTWSKNKIGQRFVLSQKGAKEEMEEISEMIGGYVEKGKGDMERVVVNYINAEKLLNYLERYELKSVKGISFKRWKEIYDIRKRGERKERLEEIRKKSKLINNLRKLEEREL